MTKEVVIFLVVAVVALFVYWRIRKNFKHLVTPCVTVITGAPKTGKDLLMNPLAQKTFKRNHRKWAVRRFFSKVFHRPFTEEEPLFYTNYRTTFGSLKRKKPHKLDRCIRKVTTDMLLRKTRPAYKSVVAVTELSLVADCMCVHVADVNTDISLFAKLFGHISKGGAFYGNTQNSQDTHYGFKRVASTFFFVQKGINFGLFHVLYVREMVSSDLGAVNAFNDDVDTTTRKVLVPFWWHNRYDRYELSYFTDECPVSDEPYSKGELVTFSEQYRKRAWKHGKEQK